MAQIPEPTGPGRPGLAKRDVSDFECPLCQNLLFEPVTTSCGHTYCKECIVRTVDHNNKCPVCRATISILQDFSVNVLVQSLIAKNFPREFELRQRESEELRHDKNANQLPLFILDAVLFPNMQLPLHVFEPRYRLMLRRCIDSTRKLGIISIVNGQLAKIGTTAIIENHVKLPDGRSLVTTRGDQRFQVLDSWDQDGYKVGKISYLTEYDEDPAESKPSTICLCIAHGPDGSCISPPTPAAVCAPPMPPSTSSTPTPTTISSPSSASSTLTTTPAAPPLPPPVVPPPQQQACQKLMTEIRAEIVTKLGRALNEVQDKYGSIPESDPRAFSYWVGSLLPLSTAKKLELLSAQSTRRRLELEREFLHTQPTASQEACIVS